jgi:hypothetical protein
MAGKAKARRKRGAPKSKSSRRARGVAPVTIRHYCQGIGDCHLLTFPRSDGGSFYMLIDCGVHTAVSGGSATIDKIVDDIASVTDRIDVLVATHEHWDHISGFVTAAEKFKKFKIGAVWMGWTEDPSDAQARKLDKFKSQALVALDKTQAAFKAADAPQNGAPRLGWHLKAMSDGLQGVLGFHSFNAKGERIRSAREALKDLVPRASERYLEPKDPPIEIPGVPNLRIYVLGPPRDTAMLGIRERASEMYGLGGMAGWPMANALASAFRISGDGERVEEDWAAPFDQNIGAKLERHLSEKPRTSFSADEQIIADFMQAHYAGPAHYPALPPGDPKERRLTVQTKDQRWRRIDHDWLGAGADLAIQLDDRTNNSSVVLAFEFIDTGRVLLFPGDAQVGSWLSWQDLKWKVGDKIVTGPELLARTVYYKVGHHGSHNATLKQKGLEQMTHRDFAAFIPTNEKDAKKVKWGAMPFGKILDELGRRGSGRVIRADDAWLQKGELDARFKKSTGCIRRVDLKPGLWVELDIA